MRPFHAKLACHVSCVWARLKAGPIGAQRACLRKCRGAARGQSLLGAEPAQPRMMSLSVGREMEEPLCSCPVRRRSGVFAVSACVSTPGCARGRGGLGSILIFLRCTPCRWPLVAGAAPPAILVKTQRPPRALRRSSLPATRESQGHRLADGSGWRKVRRCARKSASIGCKRSSKVLLVLSAFVKW